MQAQKDSSSSGSTWGLALLFGLLLGGLRSSFDGVVVGALLGALTAQVLQLRERVGKLNQQLRTLSASQRFETHEQTSEPAINTSASTAGAEPAGAAASSSSSDQAPASRIVAAPQPRSTTAIPVAQPAAAKPAERINPTPSISTVKATKFDRVVEESVAWLKRGNPLARIGIVILFFGGAFLAKYAAENSLFPIELRFIAIALGALALLLIGWRLRERRAVYAQLLQGGGVAGLYLTVFAATSLFKLLPFGLALGLMIAIAVAAAILAVAQNALSLAVIASAGGFLAPILVSSGSGNHVALFTYYAVLNLGIFAVAWFRTWRLLNVLGFLFTFSITGLWRATGYTPADLVTADAFLILFFLMYVAVSILNCLRQPPDLKGYVSGSLVFGLPVVAFTLHATLVAPLEFGLAWSALVLGTFYLVLAWALFLIRRLTLRLLVESFAALGVIFASLAIPLAFDTRTTAAMWAVEGAGLLWLGVRQNRRLARAFATLLQLAAGVGYLSGVAQTHAAHALLNSAYLGALMLAASGVFSAYLLYRNRERQAPYESGADGIFMLWGLAWWLCGGLREIDQFADRTYLGVALGYLALTCVTLTLGGSYSSWRLPQRTALYLSALSMSCALGYAVVNSHPFTEWGAMGWLALFTVHYWMLHRLETLAAATTAPASDHGDWLHALAYWVIALLLAGEASWQIQFHVGGVWPSLPWGLAPALLLSWLARRRLSPSWPFASLADVYRVRSAVPLAIMVIGWIVMINLDSDGDPQWLPYLPIVNPLDLSVALCVATLALWWTSLTLPQCQRVWPMNDKVLLGGMAAVIFLWLNAALLRALHHNWNTPLTTAGMAHDTLVQTSLSVFWGLLGFAAMTLAARKSWRYVWIVGGILMLVVVAKLFLVDLSKIGTLARITSFLSVGALLLVTGYLAPLPPRRATAEHAS